MKALFSIFTLSSILASGAASAATISIASYTYGVTPNPNYPDSGGELTDGVTDTIVWGGSGTVTPATAVPLVGWQGTDPEFTINFSATEAVKQLSLWLVDSDGSAGVYLPASITVTSADFSYNETFTVVNQPGAGEVRRYNFSLPSVTTTALTISMDNSEGQHTMLSEVSISSVPEPSSTVLMGLGLGAGLLRRRR